MTPMWRDAFRVSLAQDDREALEELAGMRCFDLSVVEPLVRSTADQLQRAGRWKKSKFWARDNLNDARIDVGENPVTVPAETCWLELGPRKAFTVAPLEGDRYAVNLVEWSKSRRTVHIIPDGLDFDPRNRAHYDLLEKVSDEPFDFDGDTVKVELQGKVKVSYLPSEPYASQAGQLVLKDDFVVCHLPTLCDVLGRDHLRENRSRDASKRTERAVSESVWGGNDKSELFLALAALLVINSPRSIEEKVPGSFTLREKARRARIRLAGTEIKHTRVLISVGSKALGSDKIGVTQSPKAYHFCRAHIRRKAGRIERVRAHWRGDPAFGIRLPSYQVRP